MRKSTLVLMILIIIIGLYAQPSDPEIKAMKKSSQFVRAGIELEDSLKLDLAIAEFSKAIAQRSDWPEPYYHRGRVYVKKEKYDKAAEDFDMALIYDPVYVNALMGRGNLRMNQNDFDGAFEDYQKAVELSPENLQARYNFVLSCFLTQHLKTAREHIDYVIENDKDKEYPDIYVFKGRIHYSFGKFEESEKALSKFIKDNPDNAEAYRYRSETYQALGDFDKAIKDAEKYEKLTKK